MTNAKTQLDIKSSVGNQYMATYAGTIGNIKYFECRKPNASNEVVGFVAVTPTGKVGPLCQDYVDAALRVRNIAYDVAPWLSKLMGIKVK